MCDDILPVDSIMVRNSGLHPNSLGVYNASKFTQMSFIMNKITCLLVKSLSRDYMMQYNIIQCATQLILKCNWTLRSSPNIVYISTVLTNNYVINIIIESSSHNCIQLRKFQQNDLQLTAN